MDGARHVASFPAAGLVFVTRRDSNSVCVVDVWPSTCCQQNLVDSTYMNGAFGIMGSATKLLFVTEFLRLAGGDERGGHRGERLKKMP